MRVGSGSKSWNWEVMGEEEWHLWRERWIWRLWVTVNMVVGLIGVVGRWLGLKFERIAEVGGW